MSNDYYQTDQQWHLPKTALGYLGELPGELTDSSLPFVTCSLSLFHVHFYLELHSYPLYMPPGSHANPLHSHETL